MSKTGTPNVHKTPVVFLLVMFCFLLSPSCISYTSSLENVKGVLTYDSA